MATRQPIYACTPNILQRVFLFEDLPPDELAHLAATARLRTRTSGEMLWQQGQEATRVFVLLKGRIRIYRLASIGREVTITFLHDSHGAQFDGLPLVDETFVPDTFAQVASDHATTYDISRRHVTHLLTTHPHVAQRALHLMHVRMKDSNVQIEELVAYDLPTRLMNALARLASYDDQGIVWESRSELASLVGASHEEVTRVLARLQQRGLISYRPYHRGIHIIAPHADHIAAM